MNLNDSILQDLREGVGLTRDSNEFDQELTTHANLAFMTLRQNGVGKPMILIDDVQTWLDFKDEAQVNGNEFFPMVKSYVVLSVKVLFDPPPPSMVEYYSGRLQETVWRLKTAYDADNV